MDCLCAHLDDWGPLQQLYMMVKSRKFKVYIILQRLPSARTSSAAAGSSCTCAGSAAVPPDDGAYAGANGNAASTAGGAAADAGSCGANAIAICVDWTPAARGVVALADGTPCMCWQHWVIGSCISRMPTACQQLLHSVQAGKLALAQAWTTVLSTLATMALLWQRILRMISTLRHTIVVEGHHRPAQFSAFLALDSSFHNSANSMAQTKLASEMCQTTRLR